MVNGVVRSVELLYHQLLALGHDVRVVTLAQNGHSHEENGILYVGSISAERVYPGVRISAAGALPISHWLDELEAWGPEVIHTQSEFSTFMLAQRVARRCHCPVVHTYHTVYEDYTQYLFFSERLGRMTAEKATRILSGYCSLMLAPTEKVRAMLNRYGVSCPVVTVPTGIDLTAFGPAQDNGEEKARMRAELGIPEGDTVLLSLGRLAAEKNHAQLLRLLAAQPEENRPWLVFVGDGPARPDLEALTNFGPAQDNGEEKARMRAELGIPEGDTVLLSLGRLAAEKNHAQLLRLLAAQPEENRPWLVFVGDGPARPDLEALTKELKLTDRVRFVGMVKPDEVPRWYRVGDIFVSASQSETQGLTYFEGMACGLPVLCRADPCLDGVVENGFNGWQWKDEAEFASALNTIISDPALRGQLHQNALATAARYSAEHFAQQVLDAYQQAIALKRYESEHKSILSWV